MIHADCRERFTQESIKYSKLKDKVRKYISERYSEGTKDPISVYSIRVGFQMVIGNVPQGALSIWLEEWGYNVKPGNRKVDCSPDNISHFCYLRLKQDVDNQDDTRSFSSTPRKRKGVVIY